MSDLLYQIFLDWLRRRDVVVLRLEDGTVLASGFRPRSVLEEHDAAYRANKNQIRFFASTLVFVRRKHGDIVDEFLEEWGDRPDPGDTALLVHLDGTVRPR